MTLPRLTCALLSGIVTLALARPVEAQIYVWLDKNGNPCYSSTKPSNSPYKTYTIPGTHKRATATRPVESGDLSAFDGLIEQYSATYQVRPDLVRAVIQVESGFNPRARSPKGAMGLMQLMPSTALDFGVISAYDPEDNIRGGIRYLGTLLDRYSNDETLALAAYNAGPMAVEKYGNVVPPYRETQDYVERVQHISPLSAAAATAKNQASGTTSATTAAARTVPRPQGVRVLYKTVAINADGQPVARYTDTKPASGDYEVYSYLR